MAFEPNEKEILSKSDINWIINGEAGDESVTNRPINDVANFVNTVKKYAIFTDPSKKDSNLTDQTILKPLILNSYLGLHGGLTGGIKFFNIADGVIDTDVDDATSISLTKDSVGNRFLKISSLNDAGDQIQFEVTDKDSIKVLYKNGEVVETSKIYHSGNHGKNSGLDADKIHGVSPTSLETVNTIVQRDLLGNFSANEITAKKFIGNSTNVTGIVAALNGGTGFESFTYGDILFAKNTTELDKISLGNEKAILISTGTSTAPAWRRLKANDFDDNEVIAVKNGGTGVTLSTGNKKVVLSNDPELTGTPLAPTAEAGTNTQQIATTAYVKTAISNHNYDGIYQKQNDEHIVDITKPDVTVGTWNIHDSDDWGTPRIGTYVALHGERDGYRQWVIPNGMDTCYISHLTWDSGGYVDVHGVQADGGLVLLRRINTYQSVENTDEGAADASDGGNPNQRDGSTITLAGTGLSTFNSIRFTIKTGNFHFTGMSFSSNRLVGSEGTGMVNWNQLTQVPSLAPLVHTHDYSPSSHTHDGVYQKQNDEHIVDIVAPSVTNGVWYSGDPDDWGTPRIGTYNAQYTHSDSEDSVYRQWVIPDGMDTCYISHRTWDDGGYVDVHGVQGDGGLVFLRRINTHQVVENTDEGAADASDGGNINQLDGSTITLAGTGLSTFNSIRFTVESGYFYLSGMSFSSNKLVGSEGTGMVNWNQLTQVPSLALTNAPTFTGIPAAPTAAFKTNTTQLASTAYVDNRFNWDGTTLKIQVADGVWKQVFPPVYA